MFRSAFLPLLAALLCIAAIGSCTGESVGNAPDVSGVEVPFASRRFDLDFAALDTASLPAGLSALQKKYPDFLPFYLDTILSVGINGNFSDTSSAISTSLRTFLTAKDYRNLLDTLRHRFPDTREIDARLKKGFQYLRHYYPAASVPAVVYFPSFLTDMRALITGSNVLGIGLDMYLGKAYPYYASVGIADYVTDYLQPSYIPVNVFRVIYQDSHPFVQDDKPLLDMMIQRGKEQYYLAMMLPFEHDTTRLSYTKSQYEWCKKNEAGIYSFFVSGNFLYEKSWQKILRYVNEGPAAAGMDPQSPANVGTFIGYRIVGAYMKEHPETTPEQLFAPAGAQAFLLSSKYNPR